MRKTVIAGNWKMNFTPAETKAYFEKFIPLVSEKDGCDIWISVPFVSIAAAAEATRGTNIVIGAQNVHYKDCGAFTGEISAKMLVECGAEFVIVGHSERRTYFGETNRVVNLRTRAALDAGLTAVVCVGETQDVRDLGLAAEYVEKQIRCALADVSPEQACRVVIAYEPIWAVGTGVTPTLEEVDAACNTIRKNICEMYDINFARRVRIMYGGSMVPANAEKFLALENVDGGLIGGASLKPESFSQLVDIGNL